MFDIYQRARLAGDRQMSHDLFTRIEEIVHAKRTQIVSADSTDSQTRASDATIDVL